MHLLFACHREGQKHDKNVAFKNVVKYDFFGLVIVLSGKFGQSLRFPAATTFFWALLPLLPYLYQNAVKLFFLPTFFFCCGIYYFPFSITLKVTTLSREAQNCLQWIRKDILRV